MFTVIVYAHVKPESIESFRAATLENARHSVQEPGISQFDMLHQSDDPTRFVLIETYRDDTAPAAHKATAHYQVWRDEVANMMAEPRTGTRYECVPAQ
jgi:(4S)-4-hydroxy-5-phosphonooxypentane-2,3-dione isomerase